MNKDNIKIKIILNGKNLTVDLQKNKQFKILREKVHTFFYPVPSNYIFYEKKKELNLNEEKALGEIFGTRNQIVLTIKEITNQTKQNSNSTLNIKCSECSEDSAEVSYYCRTCNTFICKFCRLNKENGQHYEHSIIQLFNYNDTKDSKRNAELYKQLLMNDFNVLKNKISKCNNMKNNQIDFAIFKKNLFEKIVLISKLLQKKKEEIIEVKEESLIKDKTELDLIKKEIESIRDDNSIAEISNDPLIEFNKINEFDAKLRVYKEKLNIQLKNEKINNNISKAQINITFLFQNIPIINQQNNEK